MQGKNQRMDPPAQGTGMNLTTYCLQIRVEAIFGNLFLNSNNIYGCVFTSNSVIYYEIHESLSLEHLGQDLSYSLLS